MGISNLSLLIKKINKSIVKRVSLNKYAGKKIAVDGDSFIHSIHTACLNKVKSTPGILDRKKIYEEGIEESLKKLIDTGIKPIFFFDGSIPIEKTERMKERLDKKILEEIEIKKNIDIYDEKSENVLSGRFNSVQKSNKIRHLQEIIANISSNKYIYKNSSKIPHTVSNDTDNLLFHLEISKKFKTFYIPLVCKILKSFDVPCYQRDGEAERNVALCVNNGLAYAAITDDIDVLAFGSKIFLHKILNFFETGMINEIHLDDILNSFNLNYGEFVDLCILLGCDYSDITISFEYAFKLIQNHKTLECIHKIYPNIMSPDQLDRAIYARAIFYRGCIVSNNIKQNLINSSYSLTKQKYFIVKTETKKVKDSKTKKNIEKKGSSLKKKKNNLKNKSIDRKITKSFSVNNLEINNIQKNNLPIQKNQKQKLNSSKNHNFTNFNKLKKNLKNHIIKSNSSTDLKNMSEKINKKQKYKNNLKYIKQDDIEKIPSESISKENHKNLNEFSIEYMEMDNKNYEMS